jgi:aerobic-type carbon monoxide dehydrogenase small subunit (CoxS/CutS family)
VHGPAVVTSAFFPALPPRSGTAFAEVARRKGDYAVCGAGVVVTLDEDRRVAAVRASYVSVGLTPEVHDLTDAVAGKPVDSADWAAAGALARTLVDPDTDLHASADYRRLLVGVLTERTLASAAAEAGGRRMTSVDTERTITVTVNGVPREATVPVRRLLSDALRHDLGLTGTHVGCEHGVCGACTVLVDGDPVRSCLMLAVQATGTRSRPSRGWPATTGRGGQVLHPVQEAFRECHALQCGFCTPGFLMTIAAGLEKRDPVGRDHRGGGRRAWSAATSAGAPATPTSRRPSTTPPPR